MSQIFEVLNPKKIEKDGKVESFLKNACSSFVDEIIKARKDLGEHPLKYREQSLKSYLLPALNKVSKRTLMEVYFNSGEKNLETKDKRNFADFYSLDEERENRYIIEVKHSWHTFGQKKLRKDTIDKWEVVNGQLQRLSYNKKAVKKFIDKNGSLYCISMVIIVTYKEVNPRSKDHLNYETFKNLVQNEITEKKVDWIYWWDVGNDLQNEEDESIIEFPTVTLIGRVIKL